MPAHDSPPRDAAFIDLATHFQAQGIREAPDGSLWCALCTPEVAHLAAADGDTGAATESGGEDDTFAQETERSVPEVCADNRVVRVGRSVADVLAHCRQRAHLVAYELQGGSVAPLSLWCPVAINGERYLIDHHAVFVHHIAGQGRMLADECAPGGMLLLPDAARAVALRPLHRYRVVELVLPPYASDSRRIRCRTGHDPHTGALTLRRVRTKDTRRRESRVSKRRKPGKQSGGGEDTSCDGDNGDGSADGDDDSQASDVRTYRVMMPGLDVVRCEAVLGRLPEPMRCYYDTAESETGEMVKDSLPALLTKTNEVLLSAVTERNERRDRILEYNLRTPEARLRRHQLQQDLAESTDGLSYKRMFH